MKKEETACDAIKETLLERKKINKEKRRICREIDKRKKEVINEIEKQAEKRTVEIQCLKSQIEEARKEGEYEKVKLLMNQLLEKNKNWR